MGKEKKPKKVGKKTDIIENTGKVLINLGQLMSAKDRKTTEE